MTIMSTLSLLQLNLVIFEYHLFLPMDTPGYIELRLFYETKCIFMVLIFYDLLQQI